MTFSFLNPMFWLGALLVAAPIWLHLRRKRERNVQMFSALRFLEDEPEARKSPWRLRDILLLALRVGALMLAVGALAWPYRTDLIPNPILESRVYILDNTLSHQAGGGFGRDRERVLRELGEAGIGIQIAVIELRSGPRVVVAFSDDRAAARRKLAELEPSDERGSYVAAFREASGLLREALGERKKLIFLGDHQENQWSEHGNVPAFLGEMEIEMEMSDPGVEERPNLSLSEPKVERLFLGDQSGATLAVKLSHTGRAKKGQVKLRVNGGVLLDREVDFGNQPETIVLQTQWETDPSAWVEGEMTISGEPDELEGDNRVVFTLAPVKEGQVVLLGQSPYLRLALSEEVMRGRWVAHALNPSELGASDAKARQGDVLCIESQYLQSAEARQLIWHYLTNRRGVLLLVNRVTPVVGGALRELGFEAQAGSATPSEQRIKYFFGYHPIFNPFLSPDFGNLTEVEVRKHARVRATQGMPLIYLESGEPVFFEGTKFPGKLFVSAFGLSREETTWPAHVSFVPFLDLCLRNARALESEATEYEPGQSVLITVPEAGGLGDSTVELRGGEGEAVIARVRAEGGRARIQLPGKAGLYRVTREGSGEVIQALAVNGSAKESRLRYANGKEAVNLWRSAEMKAAVEPRGEWKLADRASILGQDYWWWLLLGAFGALVLESVLAAVRQFNPGLGRVKKGMA